MRKRYKYTQDTPQAPDEALNLTIIINSSTRILLDCLLSQLEKLD